MFVFVQVITILAVFSNGIVFPFLGQDFNFERVVFVVAMACIAMATCLAKLRVTLPGWLYLAWGGSVILATMFSYMPLAHTNGLLISILPIIFYVVFSQNVKIPLVDSGFFEKILWIVSASAIAGFVAWKFSGANSWMIDRGRIKLLMLEPNIFGATIACFAVMTMPNFRLRPVTIAMHLVALTALILTASKAPYIAYLVGALFVLLRSGVLTRSKPVIVIFFVLVAIIATAIVYADDLSTFYNTALKRQDAIRNRMFALQFGWSKFLESPLFGNGPLDFSLTGRSILQQMGTEDTRNAWIWLIWLAVLHDEGLVGFLFFVSFLVFAWIYAERLIRMGSRVHIGYLAAMLVIIIASHTTTLHLTALFGVVMGLVTSPASSGSKRNAPASIS